MGGIVFYVTNQRVSQGGKLRGSLGTQSEENEPYHRRRTLDENRRSESYDCHRFNGLGLDQISETEDEFVIGCMATLRDLEVHPGLNAYTDGAVKQSVCHIVGVQFSNCATVGGSI